MKHLLCILLFSISIPLIAQPKAHFTSLEQNLGNIGWEMPSSATFELTNKGDKPLHILRVRTDCGCTAVEWSREAIAPGQTTKIRVSYDAKLLGSFEKLVAITTDADTRPTYLHLKGRVKKDLTFNSNDYEIHIGDFHLSTDNIEFDDVKKGTTPKFTLNVMNGSSHALHPALMHMPDYLTAVSSPEFIPSGKTGEITFILNSDLVKDYGLTQKTIYLSRFLGDKISEENALNVAVTLLPAQRSTTGKYSYAPRMELSDTTLTFPTFGKKKKLSQTIRIKNTGNAPLDISRLQVYNSGIGVSLNKSIIQPGAQAKLKITLHNTERKRGKRAVLLITNDPVLPKFTIKLKQQGEK